MISRWMDRQMAYTLTQKSIMSDSITQKVPRKKMNFCQSIFHFICFFKLWAIYRLAFKLMKKQLLPSKNLQEASNFCKLAAFCSSCFNSHRSESLKLTRCSWTKRQFPKREREKNKHYFVLLKTQLSLIQKEQNLRFQDCCQPLQDRLCPTE